MKLRTIFARREPFQLCDPLAHAKIEAIRSPAIVRDRYCIRGPTLWEGPGAGARTPVMTLRTDFTSQDYLRNPAAGIEGLRASGPIVEVRFPIVGKVWITTTQEAYAFKK